MGLSKSIHYLILLFYISPNLSYAQQDTQFVTVQPSLQTVTLSGFTRARNHIPIASEVAGKVIAIYADIGQAIPENGIFACLDDTFINLDIAATKNSIAQYNIDLKFLSKQVERHKKLVKTNSTALSLYDDLIRQKENAYYEIQRIKIKQNILQETKSRYCIQAPKNWKITQRTIEVGQWVDIGATLAQADNYKTLLLPLTLTAKELTALENKQDQLTVYLPEYQQEISAKIERISPAFDQQSHKIRVDLLITDTAKYHRGGIRAELSLSLADKLNTFLISANQVLLQE